MPDHHEVAFTLDAPFTRVSARVEELLKATFQGVEGIDLPKPDRSLSEHFMIERWGTVTATLETDFFVAREIARDGTGESLHVGHPGVDIRQYWNREVAIDLLMRTSVEPMERADAERAVEEAERAFASHDGLDGHTGSIELEECGGRTAVTADYFTDTARFIDLFLDEIRRAFPVASRSVVPAAPEPKPKTRGRPMDRASYFTDEEKQALAQEMADVRRKKGKSWAAIGQLHGLSRDTAIRWVRRQFPGEFD